MRTLILLLLLTICSNVSGLTTKQLLEACKANGRPCYELPFANAYIGGALDLLGTLKDQDRFSMQLSCSNTNEFFDVKRILIYIDDNQRSHENKNAMSLVIKYMEEESCAEG